LSRQQCEIAAFLPRAFSPPEPSRILPDGDQRFPDGFGSGGNAFRRFP
jgi:hypothetical protein